MPKVVQLKMLDQRLAAVLAPDAEPLSSAELADLIAELDVEIDHQDQAGREARAIAIDASILDPGARGRAEDSEFKAARLRNGLARVTELHQIALASERLISFHAAADIVEQDVQETAAYLLETYQRTVDVLIGLFERVEKLDHKVSQINNSAPPYEARRLLTAEMVARQIDGFKTNDQRLADQVKLPALLIGQHGTAAAWPKANLHPLGLNALLAGMTPSERASMGFPDVIVEMPLAPAPPPERTLREQILDGQAERAKEWERVVEEGKARERERQRLEDEKNNRAFYAEQEQRRVGT